MYLFVARHKRRSIHRRHAFQISNLRLLLAKVIEVASAVDARTDEETNVSGLPLKSTVLIPKTVGIKVPWDDSLRIIETRDVLALVDEISST